MAAPDAGFSFVPARQLGTEKLLGGYRSQSLVLALYECLPPFRAVVDRIAEGPAGLRWYLTAPKSKAVAQELRLAASLPRRQRVETLRKMAAEGATKRVDAHPFLAWLAEPNAQMSGYDLVHLECRYYDLLGETFTWLRQDGSQFDAWPLPPTWVSCIPSQYEDGFRIATLGRGVPPKIAAEDMLYRRNFSPRDPYDRGYGMGQALLDELASDQSASAFLKETLDTRAREDLLFLHKDISGPQVAQLETTWLQKMRTVLRRAAPMFLKMDPATRVEKLGRTLRDTQLVQVREALRNAIIQAYGMPPEVMGIIENSNRATIDAARYLAEYYLTLPRAEALQRHWQRRLLPRWTDDLVLEFDSPVPEDVERLLATAKDMPWSVKLNEVRRLCGFEGLGEDGERFAVPSGYVFLRAADLPKAIESPAPAPVPPAVSDDKEAEKLAAMTAALVDARLLAAGYLPAQMATLPPITQAPDTELGEAMVALLDRLGTSVGREIRAVVTAALDELLSGSSAAEIEAAVLDGTIDDLADWNAYRSALNIGTGARAGLTSIHADLAKRVVKSVAGELTAVVTDALPYDDLYKAAAQWAQQRSASMVTAISNETRAGLRLLVRTAYDARASVADIAKAIRPAIGLNKPQAASFRSFVKERATLVQAGTITEKSAIVQIERRARQDLNYRSKMIAQTELWETGNSVQVETWKAAGMGETYEQEWSTSPRNPCEWCIALNRQRCPVGGEFSVTVGGKTRTLKHPTAHPWCYCSVRLRRKR